MFQVKKNRSSCHLTVNVMLFFASQISDEETRENRLLFTSPEQAHLATRGVIGRPICMWPLGWPASPGLYTASGTGEAGRLSFSAGSHNLDSLPLQRLNYLLSFAFSNQFCPVHNGQYPNH
jgi:hypothetical protein